MKLLVLGATGGSGLEIVRQALVRHQSTSELEPAIQGNDAVLSAFGPRVPVMKADANLLRDFASALTSAMRRVSVRRLVIVSTAFLFRDSIVPPTYLVGWLFFPGVIVRPPQLTDKPFSGS